LTIVSINIASPARVSLDGGPKKIRSGIFKIPISEPIFLNFLGFDGDGVGDPRTHGGKDMAVCAYCVDHFPYWKEKLQRNIVSGSFGENLSLMGMPETATSIGLKYNSPKYWYAGANFNYFADICKICVAISRSSLFWLLRVVPFASFDFDAVVSSPLGNC